MTPDSFYAALRARPRSVWDARALIRPHLNRLVRVTFDDGNAPGTYWGLLRDVVHKPGMEFALVLEGLLPVDIPVVRSRRRERHERTTVPVSFCDELDEALAFLADDPENWELPKPSIRCSSCGYGSQQHEINPGRFCVSCGVTVRKGRELRFPGDGFKAAQALLHEEYGDGCARCGGGVAPDHRFCMKCGGKANEPTILI